MSENMATQPKVLGGLTLVGWGVTSSPSQMVSSWRGQPQLTTWTTTTYINGDTWWQMDTGPSIFPSPERPLCQEDMAKCLYSEKLPMWCLDCWCGESGDTDGGQWHPFNRPCHAGNFGVMQAWPIFFHTVTAYFIIFPNDSKHFQTQVGEIGLCFHATFEVMARELAGAGCCECCYGRLVARCHECI